MMRRQPPLIGPGPLTQRQADELNAFLRDLAPLLGGFSAAPPLAVSQDQGGVSYRFDAELPSVCRTARNPDAATATTVDNEDGTFTTTVGPPGSLAEGSLVVVAFRYTGTLTNGGGQDFAEVAAGTLSGSVKYWCGYRYAAAGEADYVFTDEGGAIEDTLLFAAFTDATVESHAVDSGSGTSVATTALTAAGDNRTLLLALFEDGAVTAPATPDGMALEHAGDAGQSWSEVLNDGAGGARAVSLNTSRHWAAVSLLVGLGDGRSGYDAAGNEYVCGRLVGFGEGLVSVLCTGAETSDPRYYPGQAPGSLAVSMYAVNGPFVDGERYFGHRTGTGDDGVPVYDCWADYPADSVLPGIVSLAAQRFYGEKSFSDPVTVQDAINLTASQGGFGTYADVGRIHWTAGTGTVSPSSLSFTTQTNTGGDPLLTALVLENGVCSLLNYSGSPATYDVTAFAVTQADGLIKVGATATVGGLEFSGGLYISGSPSGSSYTDEEAQDAVGTILTDSSTIDLTYSDGTPSITADVKDGSVTYAKLQDVSATDVVLGRKSSGAGDAEEIAFTDQAQQLCDDTSFSDMRTTLGLAIGTDVQAYDATLAALAGANWAANALPIGSGSDTVSQVSFAANTFPARASTGGLVAKTITDFALTYLDDTSAGATLTTLGGTTVGQSLFNLANPSAVTFLRVNADNSVSALSDSAFRTAVGLAIGANVQAWDADLDALAALSSTGLAARTASNTWTQRTLAAPAAGITITNPAGVAGDPTFALANDLAALEALSGTNTIYYRSGSDTWTSVTIGTGLSFSGGTLSNTGNGGDVAGPSSATDNAVARYDGATGKLLQDSLCTVADNGMLSAVVSDAGTANVAEALQVRHKSSSTAANGFGTSVYVYAQASTGVEREAYRILSIWADATDGTRKARVQHGVYDTAVREYLRGEASGSAAMIGFLGAGASAQLASPDAGTALVTFGLASGTPTFALANLTGAGTGVLTFLATPSSANLRAALTDEAGAGAAYFVGGALGTPASGTLSGCDAFPAAGVGHAKGLVPDPGATAYTNQPYVLCSDATWKPRVGSILGSNYVDTAETTTNTSTTSPATLATAQSLSVTLDESTDVVIYLAASSQNTGTNTNRLFVNIDSGTTVTLLSTFTMPSANNDVCQTAAYKVTLASGAHTIAFNFGCNGGTATFKRRAIVAWRA